MTIKREVNLANQPALIPMFGGVEKKPRPLDRDVIAIGRARGCDIGLDAPEVSTLHCILYRSPDGFRVRDCGSRIGTRVNGEVPRHALAEGDVLQIGPFSFTVRIPPGARPDPRKPDGTRLEHCQRSRRNVIQLALHLRRRLHQRNVGPGDEAQTELNRKATDLRNRIRQYDQRSNQLEQAERDLEADRDQLKREREGHLAHVQQVEGELAKRLEAADQEIHTRWREFQERCAQEEARLSERTKEAGEEHKAERDLESERDQLKREREGHLAHVQQVEADLAKRLEAAEQEIHTRRHEFQERCAQEEARLLERAKEASEEHKDASEKQRERQPNEEAVALAKELEKEKAELARQTQQLRQGVEVWRRQREETMSQNEQWAAQQAEAAASLAKQQATLSQAEASLREQRGELTRMMNDLRELQNTIKKQQSGDVEALKQENEELRRTLAECERRLVESAANQPADELRGENELLRHLVQEKDTAVAALQQQLEELARQSDAPKAPPPIADIDSFEAELNRDRQQLELDRAKLNKEIEQLRLRNTELDEATREMEMAMSKERAELARERMRLDRMRDEVRAEREHVQREGPIRESLASVNKLRGEMKNGAAKDDGKGAAVRRS
jgi:pSer/pThr/pTyr-binding forkhead associated (FHA) protein